jgi:SAM-dependent methyltransferase
MYKLFSGRVGSIFLQTLQISQFRETLCWIRYSFWLKNKLRILPEGSGGIGQYTVEHNLLALNKRAGFGVGGRMSLLLYPLAALLRRSKEPKVLIVGPRTEDDIYWAFALGIKNVRGLDLFSYSPWIDIGDIHKTDYQDQEFDAVILGWVISYSAEPIALIEECKRIIKRGGYLGFGIESNPEMRRTGKFLPPRVNMLNSSADISLLVRSPIVFIYDPELSESTDNAVIFQLP